MSQLPASLVASTGANVRIENTCFYDNTLGQLGSPILYLGKDTSLVVNGNQVSGSSGCGLWGEMKQDGTVACNDIAIPTNTTCDATWHAQVFDFDV